MIVSEADMGLIATAPEMLDALIGAEIVIRMLAPTDQEATLNTLRRVIDKAQTPVRR